MEESKDAGGVRYPKAEELVGREYNCCRGPLRNQAVRVIEQLPRNRFRLEAEDGTKFRISGERLERIFGDRSSRICACCPVEEISLAATQPDAKRARRQQPARPHQEVAPEEEAATETQDESTREPAATSQPAEHAQEESTHAAASAPASVMFTGDSPQGLLFG